MRIFGALRRARVLAATGLAALPYGLAFLCVVLISGLFVGPQPVVMAQSLDAKALVLPPTDVEPGWQAASATGDASAYEVQYINATTLQYSRFAVMFRPTAELAQQAVGGLVPPQQSDSKQQVDTLNPTDLGDGPALRFTVSSSDSILVGYAFHVGPVLMRVLVGQYKGPR